MSKNIYIKVGFVLLILIVIRLLVVCSFNYVNLKVTNYVEIVDNTITTEEIAAGDCKALLLEENQEDNYTFYVKSPEKLRVSFIYEDGQSAYSIYVGDDLKRQNFDKTLNGFTKNIAYGVFDIDKDDYDFVEGSYIAEVKLLRHNNNRNVDPIFFFGTKDTIREKLLIRIMYNTFMIICFLIIMIISSFLYYKDKAIYMLIILLISIVSVFKSIVSGEYLALSNIFGITMNNYFFYERLTTDINHFLYLSLLYTLYQFKIKNHYIILYVGLVIILTGQHVFQGNDNAFILLYFIGVIIRIPMYTVAYIKGKQYSMVLLITYSIFAGTNIYHISILSRHLKQGYLSSVVYGPQIGSIIYILGFLIAVIMTYFRKIKEFEKRQEEYKRINLLRGISHDLKLPLSVIKLNNQILEKYEMTNDEKKEYAKNSIEATQELEKMTDNINSYLNIEGAIGGDNTTSVKNSFEKLRKYYHIYIDKNYKFEVICDKEDCQLYIEPIQFDRMLYNLVDNAFKYNKKNGEVYVEYRIMNKEIIIKVEDTGIGIKQEDADKIFTPFYRIDKSRTKDGLGIGLSVVKEIVESLKGNIKVESKEGVGTKMIIVLPKSA